MKYRIKINELKDGTMQYIPQFCDAVITGSWRKRLELRWKNIIDSNIRGEFILSSAFSEWYETESMANEVVNQYKKQLEVATNKRIIKTSYKDIS